VNENGAQVSPEQATPTPGSLDVTALRRSWDATLDAVNRRKRTTKALLLNAQVLSLQGRALTLGFTTAALVRAFQQGTNSDVLKEALTEVLGLDVDVLPTVAGEQQPLPSQAASQAPAPSAPAYEGFAPGDEIEPVDPDAPEPERAALGEDAALALVQDQLGGTVVRTSDS
jgi:DNA polymerase-3 subunit gamma/tau